MKTVTAESRKKAGFTLLESVIALAVFSLIGLLITVGIDLAVKVQNRAVFDAESAMLCDTLNTALRDVLRLSSSDGDGDGKCRITCPSFGAENGYFFCGRSPEDETGNFGVLYLCPGTGEKSQPVVNSGTYGGMQVTDFVLSYDRASGCFSCTYTVISKDGKQTRDSTLTVRTLEEPGNGTG